MQTKSDPRKDDEVAKALQILTQDRARKMEACMKEIQAILDSYGFDLAVSNPSISLVPKATLPDSTKTR